MQEVVKLIWCDQHLVREGVRREALGSRPVEVDGKTGEVDLCEECDAEVLGPLRDLLAAIGSRAKGAATAAPEQDPNRKPETKTQCPICLGWMSVRNRQKHAKESHEVDTGSIEWRYGFDVEEVWPCSCGLTFPSTAGRSRHGRFYDDHDTSGTVSQEPLRPIVPA